MDHKDNDHLNHPLKSSSAASLNIANNLRKLMTSACISEHELSRRTNVKQPIISRILSGKNTNPKLLTLKPIADYFMVTISQLIGEQEITNYWSGFTSSKHAGWTDIPLFNWEKISKDIGKEVRKSVATENSASKSAFALCITDESMEPIIPRGSAVIIDPEIKPSDDDFVAIKKSEDILVRNLIVKSGIQYINCINNKHGSITKLSNDEKILGVVIRTLYNFLPNVDMDK